MKQTKLKIGVVHIYNFPVGMAPTTRIIAYCKGLKKLGADVEILSIVPHRDTSEDNRLCGECDGGHYYHFCHAPKCRIPLVKSILWRLKNKFCIHKALQHIINSHKVYPYDAIILSFDEPWQFKAIVPTLHKLGGMKVIAIADEYPIPIRHYLKSEVPASKLNQYKKIYQYIDGRILMTEKLRQFYDTKVCVKPTLILSTIVDTERFRSVEKLHSKREYLCYMGNMELSKDNVDNIILAFDLIKDKYPNLDLYLYGAPNKNNRDYLEHIIQSKRLNNRVFLKGKVDYASVPTILAGAKILVASQPDTKRAEGGFPTKLGEYFMTGVPSILTNVGEISEYVENGETGYLVPPCDPQQYAGGISYILNNYTDALTVAQNARHYILNNFTSNVAGYKIIEYINNLPLR